MRKKKAASLGENGVMDTLDVSHVITPPVESKKPVAKSARTVTSHQVLLDQIDGQVDQWELLQVLSEVRNWNFAVRMPIDNIGVSGKICDTLNEIIAMNERMIQEFTKAGTTIGKQGKLTKRI